MGNFNTEVTKNNMAYEKAAEQKWFLSVKPAKPVKTVTLKLNNKKNFDYLSKDSVNKGDVAIVGWKFDSTGMGASTYQMGNVNNVLDGGTLKKSVALNLSFVFSTNPEKADLVSSSKFPDTSSEEKAMALCGSNVQNKPMTPVDWIVKSVLNATTIVAYPDLVKPATLEDAKALLKAKKKIPDEIYKEGLWAVCSIAYSGYYPDWQKDLESNPDFVAVEEKGEDYPCLNEFSDKGKVNELKVTEEYLSACNKIIYLSAMAILIRGGFVNLLKAFLSAEPPISGFYDEAISLAKNLESDFCLEVLEENKNMFNA